MAKNEQFLGGGQAGTGRKSANVKQSQNYERFGETIRYLTLEEWQKLTDCIDDYPQKNRISRRTKSLCMCGAESRMSSIRRPESKWKSLIMTTGMKQMKGR